MIQVNQKIYRARGRYNPTGRESWVTTVWRRNREEAEDDLKFFASGGDRWGDVHIVERGYGQYLKKRQNIPRF